jgi:hypothetical protein
MEFRRSGEGIALLDIHLSSYCLHWHAVDNHILNLSNINIDLVFHEYMI